MSLEKLVTSGLRKMRKKIECEGIREYLLSKNIRMIYSQLDTRGLLRRKAINSGLSLETWLTFFTPTSQKASSKTYSLSSMMNKQAKLKHHSMMSSHPISNFTKTSRCALMTCWVCKDNSGHGILWMFLLVTQLPKKGQTLYISDLWKACYRGGKNILW